jgi:cytochrome c553
MWRFDSVALMLRRVFAFFFLLLPVAAGAQPNVADTMAQRMQACAVCHGREGRSTPAGYFPRIAGKPEGYLYNQLVNFRTGRRSNAAMQHLLAQMTDAYLHEIAAYFAALDLPYPPPEAQAPTAAQTQSALRLIREGAPERGLPACTGCHGDAMTGRQPAVPGLLGLPRDYLIGQLGNWRTGARHAQAPDCMAQIAQRLSADEVAAVTAWLAAQPLPADPHAAPQSAAGLPVACGGAAR